MAYTLTDYYKLIRKLQMISRSHELLQNHKRTQSLALTNTKP